MKMTEMLDNCASHNYQVRRATLTDVPPLAPLFDAYRQFYAQAPDLATAQAFIAARLGNDESVVLLAEKEGKALGFCQLYPSFCSVLAAPIYVLSDLFVQPDARKLGVARELLLQAEQLALENDKARMDLTTAKTNLAAQELYESLGWQRDEVFYAYTREPGAECTLTDDEVDGY